MTRKNNAHDITVMSSRLFMLGMWGLSANWVNCILGSVGSRGFEAIRTTGPLQLCVLHLSLFIDIADKYKNIC